MVPGPICWWLDVIKFGARILRMRAHWWLPQWQEINLLSSCILAMSCTSWTSLSLWLTEDSDMAEVVDSLSRSSTRMSWDDSRDNRFETSQLKQKLLNVGKPWLAGTDLSIVCDNFLILYQIYEPHNLRNLHKKRAELQCYKTIKIWPTTIDFPNSQPTLHPFFVVFKWNMQELSALSSTNPQAIVVVKEKPKTPQLISFEIKMI